MEESEDLHLLSVSFPTAPAVVREALSFSQTEAAALLRAQSIEWPKVEALVLSTCNRSEFYLAAPRGSGIVDGWLADVRRTRTQVPILRRALLDERVSLRPQRLLLVIDAGLPSNIETGAAVTVIDIDAIRKRQETVLSQRRAVVPDVERIVEEEVRAWERWYASLLLENLIKALYRETASCNREVAQHLLTSDASTPAHAEQVVSRSVKRLLHRHVRRLHGVPPAREGAR